MGRFQNLYIQVSYIVLVSIIISLLFNQVRESPLSFVKTKVEVVSVLKSSSSKTSEPSIIGIDLELAEKLFEEKGINNEIIWQSILENDGSVGHLKELSSEEKDCFKTAFEIDQRWIIEMASDRTPFICQSQSINLYLSADIDKWDLMMLHWKAWELGVKSLYYCRSKSIQRASYAGVEGDNTSNWPKKNITETKTDYEECLSCQ